MILKGLVSFYFKNQFLNQIAIKIGKATQAGVDQTFVEQMCGCYFHLVWMDEFMTTVINRIYLIQKGQQK